MSKQYPGGIISKTPVTPSGPYENSTASGIWTLNQQAYWRKLNQWPIAGSVQPDPQFNYVTMLLHGDGTNGAQNNTFVDSSTNNFTITRNGNTTQGSFSPYGSNWSNYLGSGNSIYISTSSVFAFTAAFTIEAWVFLNSTSGAVDPRLINIGGGIDILFVNSTKAVQVKNNATTVLTSSSSAVSLNTWSHIAVVRNGSTLTIYVNGTSVGSATYSTTFSDAGDARIARLEGSGDGYLDGYISNLRIVKGSAVYTGSFTPSTTPLTAITNTVLLTCQSNRFVDNSASPFGLTPSGSPSVQRFNPFGASTAYSTSVIGGSGYFDGSGDYLVSPASSSYQFAGDFTIEYWANLSNISGVMPIGQTYTSNNFQIYYSADGSIEFGGSGIGLVSTSAGAVSTNNWHHAAMVRSGSTITLYINGVSKGTITSSSTVGNNADIGIGARPNNAYNCTGYISNVRLVSSAVYTTTFTPPTTPFTAISGTVLLLSTTNGAIFDNAMMNDLQTVGDAQISTIVVKYGTGSIAFDGAGDYLLGASNPNMSFGAGDFTTEAWVYRTASPGNNQTIFQKGRTGDSNLEFTMLLSGSNFLSCFYTTDGTTAVQPFSSTTAVALNTWTHIAVTRSGSTWRCFVNGTLEATTTAAVTLYTSTGLISSGANPIGDNPLTGYIDELRITKGYCRYTATFTPPTAAFPNIGPT